MTEIVANGRVPRGSAYSHNVRYVDLCRALRLNDSAAVLSRGSDNRNSKTSSDSNDNASLQAMLPVGWKEMEESRKYA